jgi:mono/diheme cytochrome c family protein
MATLADAALLKKSDCVRTTAAAFGFVALNAIVFLANANEMTSVWQGVYTKQQTARGQGRYFAACATCHGGLLQATSESPELAGAHS